MQRTAVISKGRYARIIFYDSSDQNYQFNFYSICKKIIGAREEIYNFLS